MDFSKNRFEDFSKILSSISAANVEDVGRCLKSVIEPVLVMTPIAVFGLCLKKAFGKKDFSDFYSKIEFGVFFVIIHFWKTLKI